MMLLYQRYAQPAQLPAPRDNPAIPKKPHISPAAVVETSANEGAHVIGDMVGVFWRYLPRMLENPPPCY